MFTNRFIKVPTKVYDVEHEEMTNERILEDSWMKFNPMEVSHYKPSYDEDREGSQFNGTFISMKNGHGFYTYLTIGEFEELLNNHQK